MIEQPAPIDWEAYAKSLEVDAGLAVAQWEAEKEAHFATAQERDRAVEALRHLVDDLEAHSVYGPLERHGTRLKAVLAEQEKEQR